MTKMKIQQCTITDEMGKQREFTYDLVVEVQECQGLQLENYGVAISEEGGNQEEVLGITSSRSRIEGLLDLLIQYQVSPITLLDVVSDWL